MTRADFRMPSIDVSRKSIGPGRNRYALIVTSKELSLSAHSPFDDPGKLMIAGHNEKGDFRPVTLSPAEAMALRDALNLFLEDIPAF